MDLRKKIAKVWQDTISFSRLTFRRLRLVKINRNFLVFLIFLGISTCFWCIQAINDGYEVELEYKLTVEDLPANQIYASLPPESFKVKVKGRGLAFLTADRQEQEVTINYKNDTDNSMGRIRIDINAIRRAVKATLSDDIQIVSISPQKMEFDVTTGIKKRVPIVADIQSTLANNRIDLGTIITPDSLTVYATEEKFKQLKYLVTEQKSFSKLADSTTVRLAIVKEKGVKLDCDSVDVTLCIDLIAEKTIEVPILTENIPANKMLRPFPVNATVKFSTNSALKDRYTKKDFLVAIDFLEIKPGDKHAKLHLRMFPDGIRNVKIIPDNVEYVIEQQGDE